MEIVFISCFFPDENLEEILNNSTGIVQNAADSLQKAIVEGLMENDLSFEIINLPALGSYPKRYKKIFTPNNEFRIICKTNPKIYIKGRNYGYFNLSLVRYKSKECRLSRALLKWADKNQNEKKIIILYSLSVSALTAAVKIKKVYSDVHIICIVPDLPQFVSAGGTSIIRKWYKRKSTRKVEQMYQYIDGYVVLTENMISMLHAEQKPYEVIEGIYDTADELQSNQSPNHETHYIAYAGTLAKRYGIMNLVKAFSSIKNSTIRLVICGEGDSRSEIEEFAKNDGRILLTGNISRKEVLKIIDKATVLVNPRTPEGEYTKYSFPSKTMEYLASGVPTILFKLPGIPEEYYRYCKSLSDIGIEQLAEAINDVLGMTDQERINMGEEARQFILNNKNPKVQTEKIVKLIKRVCQYSKIKSS